MHTKSAIFVFCTTLFIISINADSKTKEEHFLRARLAGYANRYDDMVEDMKSFTQMSDELNKEERQLLNTAYQSATRARRSSRSIVFSYENKLKNKGTEDKYQLVSKYKEKIEKEIQDICNDVLELLNSKLFPKAQDDLSKVFYLKMVGDYNRYLAEITEGGPRDDAVGKAEKAYDDALNIAKTQMPPTHTMRLGLILNFSVFYYEMKLLPKKACEMAEQAYKDATGEELGLTKSTDDTKKTVKKDGDDPTFILELLQDNVKLWKSKDKC